MNASLIFGVVPFSTFNGLRILKFVKIAFIPFNRNVNFVKYLFANKEDIHIQYSQVDNEVKYSVKYLCQIFIRK